MDVDVLLRSVRQQRGLSQRALAQAAGVDPSVVARIEAGRTDPPWSLVSRLLRAADRDLALALPGPGVDDETRAWLHLSTSHRLYLSLGGRQHYRFDPHHGPWRALGRLAAGRTVVLSPVASVGLWLPHHAAPSPLPVTAVTHLDVCGDQPAILPELEISVGPVALQGLVKVGVHFRWEVLAWPPGLLQLYVEPWLGQRLRDVASVLEAERRRDAQGRRPAPHTSVRVAQEESWVSTRRRFGDKPRAVPSPLDRRDWRLNGEASFREWLARHGYPLGDDERM